MKLVTSNIFCFFLIILPFSAVAQQFDINTFLSLCPVWCVAQKCDAVKLVNQNDTCRIGCSKQYGTSELCAKSDIQCWNNCKDLGKASNSTSLGKVDVHASYSNDSNSDPNEILLNWTTVKGSQYYLVQWKVDLKIEPWKTISTPLKATRYVFKKTTLCGNWAFRIIAISGTLISYSDMINVGDPPITYDNFKWLDHKLYFDENGQNLILKMKYTPLKGWNKKDYTVNVMPMPFANCQNGPQQPVRDNDTYPEVEVFLSAMDAFSNCRLSILFQSSVSRCNPDSMPSSLTLTPNGVDQFKAVDIHCWDVENLSQFPNLAKKCQPSEQCSLDCDVNISTNAELVNANLSQNYSCTNGTTQEVMVRISWVSNKLILPPACVPVGYILEYGPIQSTNRSSNLRDTTMPLAEDPITGAILHNIDFNRSTLETLPNNTMHYDVFVEWNQFYLAKVCRIFNTTRLPITHQNLTKTFRKPIYINPLDCKLAGNISNSYSLPLLIAIPLTFACIVAICVIIFIILKRKEKKKLEKMKIYYETENRYVAFPSKPEVGEIWELDRKRLILFQDEPLGQGAFGKVFKGRISGLVVTHKGSRPGALAWEQEQAADCLVAVKQCYEYADESTKKEFLQEISLMKKLGHHEKLVNMLHCITDSEPYCLIVEYCSDGDMLHFLRQRRKYMIKLEEAGIDYVSGESDQEFNRNMILCLKDLVSFSFQISDGMEYLSQKFFVHRDLAARNILVDQGKRAKIGDFGLCRYVYSDAAYMSKGGKLPIKWLSIEAIESYEFTIKNDIWAFGVLLFEIITLGGAPYPDILPEGDIRSTMLNYLLSGNRMEQPANCPLDLYDVMLWCWKEDPEFRPNFSEVKESLRKMLEALSEDSQFYIDPNRSYYNVQHPDEDSRSVLGEAELKTTVDKNNFSSAENSADEKETANDRSESLSDFNDSFVSNEAAQKESCDQKKTGGGHDCSLLTSNRFKVEPVRTAPAIPSRQNLPTILYTQA